MNTIVLKPNAKNILLAANEIKSGGLVGFPTETVYGLGADAFCPSAVKKIFLAKGRPQDNPLIVHFSHVSDIEKAGIMDSRARIAAQNFMPGPLTIVLKKQDSFPSEVTAGLSTVAVRIPDNLVALRLIKESKTGIAAPSANTSSRPSPTTAAHVYSDLNGKIKYILDGGQSKIGLESTILDFSGEKIRLLRSGGIPLEKLQALLGEIEVYTHISGKPLSPGMQYRHYAPSALIKVFEFGEKDKILKEYSSHLSSGKAVKVMGVWTQSQKENLDSAVINTQDFNFFDDVEKYAYGFYSQLRQADAEGAEIILCELAPSQGIGHTINNRINKAAGDKKP